MASGYETQISTHCIGGTDYQIFSLKDRDQFYDPEGIALAAGISSATWPIFGVVWPAGMVLAEIMSTHRLENLKVLELGCGLGFASLIVNARGGDVTASDHHPLAATFLVENTRLNAMADTRYRTCDWHNPITTLGKFDLIIGSDLLYEPNHPELLSRFIDLHASRTAEIIIVGPKRRPQMPFKKQMEALGFSVVSENSSALQWDQHAFKGKIFTFRRTRH